MPHDRSPSHGAAWSGPGGVLALAFGVSARRLPARDGPGFGDAVARLKRSAGDPGALVRQPLEPSQPAPKCETKLHREIFSGQTIVSQH